MRFEQCVAERAIHPGRDDVHRCPLEDLAQQRVAVGVRARRCNTDQHVAGGDVGTREQVGLVGDTDQSAGDVERTGLVDAGHLGGLAAEDCAVRRTAGVGHALHDVGDHVGVEHARGDVVEEEQRASVLYEHVADAVVDDVHTDAAHPPESGSELHLGSHAVGRCHEHRVVEFLDRCTGEHATEAAESVEDTASRADVVRRLDRCLHLVDGACPFVDVDAGIGIRRRARRRERAKRCLAAPACRRSGSLPCGRTRPGGPRRGPGRDR